MMKFLSILFGCFLTSVGLIMLNHSFLVTGGTAGLALNIAYLFSTPFAIVFFIINIPFYIFSVIRMGLKFTLYTAMSVSILTAFLWLGSWLLPDFTLPIVAGAIVGGLLVGLGSSVLFINGSSLGGAQILALFLQKRYNFNPGKTNFIFDFIVVVSSIYTVGLIKGLCSILSIAIASKVIGYFKNQIATTTKTKKIKDTYTVKNSIPAS